MEKKYLTFVVIFPKCEIFFYHMYQILNLYAFAPLKLQTILCYSQYSCFYAIKCKHFHFTKQCEFLQFYRINHYKLDYKVRNMFMGEFLFDFLKCQKCPFVKLSSRYCSYCNLRSFLIAKCLKNQMCEKNHMLASKKLHGFKNANIENPN